MQKQDSFFLDDARVIKKQRKLPTLSVWMYLRAGFKYMSKTCVVREFNTQS